MTVEAPQLVQCGSCGCRFELSARNARAARTSGRGHVCRECRHPRREPSEAERERLRRWWLARFTLDELRELGGGWAEG